MNRKVFFDSYPSMQYVTWYMVYVVIWVGLMQENFSEIFGYNQISWSFSIVPVMVLSVAEYLYVVIIFTFLFLANQKFLVLKFMKTFL